MINRAPVLTLWATAVGGPESVQKYLERKFRDALEDVFDAMLEPAKSLPRSQPAEKPYTLYEKFRPEVPPGKKIE
jgi:hypothetical protein